MNQFGTLVVDAILSRLAGGGPGVESHRPSLLNIWLQQTLAHC
jgi:hypothetical protein